MIDSILALLASGAHIAATWFESKQSPDMQAAARAQRLAALQDKVQADIAAKNVAAVQQDLG